MNISVFQIFKIGIGPSSSHTMGPMKAAKLFVQDLESRGSLGEVHKIQVELYGSLAATGIGHCTDKALLLGLEGDSPETVDPKSIDARIAKIHESKRLCLLGQKVIEFAPKDGLIWLRTKLLPFHPNGMIFYAYDSAANVVAEETYYSVGGGKVVTKAEASSGSLIATTASVPYPFNTAQELIQLCESNNLTITEIMFQNESALRPHTETTAYLDRIWKTMNECIDRGCEAEGELPGKLKVKRRAAYLYKELTKRPEQALQDPLTILDWVNLYALAVNEENASGSKVVTAPTNGAAGIIPAVLRYYERFCPGANTEGVYRFFMTSTAIGALYAKNASISGAEVGCQGEVGVACSMAAGGLVAALGGDHHRIEQAAEIGMEHNLGLTCDPIGGLVQIPCIERNAMGAVKAINAARIAIKSEGTHYVTLDSVIQTMRQTGADMKDKYKETSRGGLAVHVNIPEC